ncbi:g11917 [Coccomyxa viridis]|uniref:G11917 protein n=1 Tax=Coccomyxa viridis TaxID=1274662 RepID=A0ABP1G9E7_9CHLO
MLQDLPATLYKDLLEEHLSPLEVKTLRLVSRKCRSFIDTTITALKPKDPSQLQHWELVKLFSNLESLDLRQHTEEACEEGQSPFEQLTALTRLKHLKVQWHKSWCNFTLTQVTAGQKLTDLETLYYEHAELLRDEDLRALSPLINLRELSLRGTRNIPLSISGAGLAFLKDLPHLRSLDVSHCRGMQAEGIHAIATLTQLTALNLNTIGLIFEYQKGLNEFPTAHFPGILGLLSCLTGLQKLDLGRQDCRGILPNQALLDQLACLTRLTALKLDLSDPPPTIVLPAIDGSALLSLRELRILRLDGWPIYLRPRGALSSGSIGAELALTELSASIWRHKDYEGLLHAALRGGKLKALQLNAHGQFRAATFEDMSHLWTKATALSHLKFRGCSVGSLPELQKLPMLKSLVFSGCSVSAEVLHQDVSGVATLETLHFHNGNSLTEEVFGQVAQITALQDLDLSAQDNFHDGSIYHDIRSLSALTQLTSLVVRALRVEDCGLHAIRNLKHLRNLNLHDGRCTDEGLRELTKLTALRTLCLWCCHHITPDGVRAVVVPLSRHALGWVDVTGCRHLTPLGPQWVKSMGVMSCATHRQFEYHHHWGQHE